MKVIMATIKRFEEIQAWQKARELSREIYRCSRNGPLAKDFGLRDQIQRAAVSVMTNIAEGYGRGSDREFSRFLDIARGSVIEVQSLLYTAKDCEYLDEDQFSQLYRLCEGTIALIIGLTNYLRKIPSSKTPVSS
jgi:four helix bundle protein